MLGLPLKAPDLLKEKGIRIALVFIVLVILSGLYIAPHINNKKYIAVDFPSFYYAAKLAFENDLSPYNNSSWKLVEPLYTDGKLFPFLYPPPSLLLFRPFLLFNYPHAKTLMLWSNHVLILVVLYLFFRKILDSTWDNLYLIPAIAYLYLFYPLSENLSNGQVGLWILTSICLTWLATKERWHPFWVALPLVFGIVLKLYPILFLLVYLFRKEYRVIIYAAVLLAMISAFATVALPGEVWQDWYESVLSNGYGREVGDVESATPANQSINAFITRLFYGRNVRFENLLNPPPWAALTPYILSSFVIAVSFVAAWWVSRKGMNSPESLSIQFCLWILVMFLIAPFSWGHHLVHVLPPIYLSVLYAFKKRSIILTAATGAIAIFLAYPFPSNDPFFRRGIWTVLISSQLFAIGFLWLIYVYLCFATPRLRLKTIATIKQ